MKFCALLWQSMKRREEAAGWRRWRKRKEWEEEVEEKEDYGYLQSLWDHPFIQDPLNFIAPYHCLLCLLSPS